MLKTHILKTLKLLVLLLFLYTFIKNIVFLHDDKNREIVFALLRPTKRFVSKSQRDGYEFFEEGKQTEIAVTNMMSSRSHS